MAGSMKQSMSNHIIATLGKQQSETMLVLSSLVLYLVWDMSSWGGVGHIQGGSSIFS